MRFENKNEARRRRIIREGDWNGIDYLEVGDRELQADESRRHLRQRLLRVYFLNDAPGDLSAENFRVMGGRREMNIQVEAVEERTSRGLTIRVDRPGDFSTYTLRIVRDKHNPEPPPGFDPLLSSVEFTFKAECPDEFDCEAEESEGPAFEPAPPLDYLTRDYGGFRRLILDRLSVSLPAWRERNPADLGVTLVEAMAAAADYRAYHQDAVATEAYLGTARRRISVRRHARMLDYIVHDGCNARVFVVFDVEPFAEGAELERGTMLLTRRQGLPIRVSPEDAEAAANQGALVFETMHSIRLSPARNVMPLYAWGESRAILPRGATGAVVELPAGNPGLRAGDFIVFEEVRGAETGIEADARIQHRHVVRLDVTRAPTRDELYGRDIQELTWRKEDALPFDLTIGTTEEGGAIAVARGNVALADHGRTLRNEALDPPEAGEGRYNPRLRLGPVTRRVVFEAARMGDVSASRVLHQDPRRAEPDADLRDDSEIWRPRRDLLNSDRFATEFVLESEQDGEAVIRFGDNILGKRPAPGTVLKARYRVGNGPDGNVGAETIAHGVWSHEGITVRNPLPARGGTAAESLEKVRLHAPLAFKKQERAVTEGDYTAMTERHPEVQKAQARLRWTGSRHTVFVSVDRREGRPVDDDFQLELLNFLERFRLSGHDLEVIEPAFVPLDIVLRVRVLPGYLRSTVKEELLKKFGAGWDAMGERAFFHPDNFTFGQALYSSGIIARAMETAGVEWVDMLRFEPFGRPERMGLVTGVIVAEPLEIMRLDGDPDEPGNGRIDFVMEGGL